MIDLWAGLASELEYQQGNDEERQTLKRKFLADLILDLAEPGLSFDRFTADTAAYWATRINYTLDDLLSLLEMSAHHPPALR